MEVLHRFFEHFRKYNTWPGSCCYSFGLHYNHLNLCLELQGR
ncbi:hypothetical protein FLA_1454 [Filimonas lacunae]|nr:hypothetical protein FLA_1454 [Filimonas lacunae]